MLRSGSVLCMLLPVLGGCFKHALFLPLPEEMFHFDEDILSKGLVQPPTSYKWSEITSTYRDYN